MSRRRRLFGASRGFESAFDSASGTRAALILDYAGAVGGQFYDGVRNTLSFDDLHTFVRASLATQRDNAGLIKFAPHNLVKQSNDFDTTWTPVAVDVPTLVATGPDGATSGWLLQCDTAGGSAACRTFQNLTVTTSSTFKFQIYAKKDQVNFLVLRPSDFSTPANNRTYFNLNTGNVEDVGVGHTATIVDAGNGWHLCGVEFTTDDTDTAGSIRVEVVANNGDSVVARDGLASIFLFGAAFYQTPMAPANDTFATTYIPTTVASVFQHRLDHDKSGNRTGLMEEEARTNGLKQSNAFTTSPWVVSGSTAAMSASVTGPDGVSNSSWLLVDDGSDDPAANVFVESESLTVETTTGYTYSVYAKEKDAPFLILRTRLFTTPGNGNASFNLSTGGIETVDSGRTATMVDAGNGWWRCSITFTTDGTDTEGSVRVYVADTNNQLNSPLDGTSSIHVFGAQFEKGNHASSYIPTTTVVVTRAAEDTEMAVSLFGYDADTGSVIANWIHPENTAPAGVWMFNDGTPTQARGIALESENIRFVTRDASNANVTATTTANSGTEYKAAAAWNSSKHAFLSVNGGAVASDIVDTISPTITHLYIGFQNTAGSSNFNHSGPIKSITYFAPKLSDADLIAGSTV